LLGIQRQGVGTAWVDMGLMGMGKATYGFEHEDLAQRQLF